MGTKKRFGALGAVGLVLSGSALGNIHTEDPNAIPGAADTVQEITDTGIQTGVQLGNSVVGGAGSVLATGAGAASGAANGAQQGSQSDRFQVVPPTTDPPQ